MLHFDELCIVASFLTLEDFKNFISASSLSAACRNDVDAVARVLINTHNHSAPREVIRLDMSHRVLRHLVTRMKYSEVACDAMVAAVELDKPKVLQFLDGLVTDRDKLAAFDEIGQSCRGFISLFNGLTIGSSLRQEIIDWVHDLMETMSVDEDEDEWTHFQITVEYLINQDIPDDDHDAIGLLTCMFNNDRFSDFYAVMHHQEDTNWAALEWFSEASDNWLAPHKPPLTDGQWKCILLALDCLDEEPYEISTEPILYCAARRNDVDMIEKFRSGAFEHDEFEAILRGIYSRVLN
jgi:hypothetical protein